MCNIIIKHKLSDFIVSYIDDILIFSKIFSEHIEHLSKLFEAKKIEGFRLKFMKCRFAADWLKYLDHIIQENSVRSLKDNLIAIKKLYNPKNGEPVDCCHPASIFLNLEGFAPDGYSICEYRSHH